MLNSSNSCRNKPNILHVTTINTMQIKYNLTSSTAASVKYRSLYRSARYRVRSIQSSCERGQTSNACGPSAYTTIRVKRTAPMLDEQPLNRTSHDWAYLLPVQKPTDKSDYIETFNSMMSSKMAARRNTVDWRTHSRINLPSLEENEESQFCVLDPMPITIDYIDQILKESNQGLMNNRNEAANLSKELAELKQQTQKRLTQLSNETHRRIETLLIGIRNSSVYHIQSKQETKEKVEQIQKQITDIKKTFDDILQKSQNLQHRVFDAHPYELVENQKLLQMYEPFSEKLF